MELVIAGDAPAAIGRAVGARIRSLELTLAKHCDRLLLSGFHRC